MEIRHIAADIDSDACFLAAEFKHRVRLWSFEQRSLVAELDTVLDFGGHRLALCRSGDDPVVVAGAWERHGICAYAPDGSQAWQRKDLRRPQQLSPAQRGQYVVACFDEKPMHVLAAGSGETVAKVRAIRHFHASRFGEVGLGADFGHALLLDTAEWSIAWKVPVEGFALLSAAAAPGAFAVADVADVFDERGGGPPSSVSALNLDGEVLWRWEAPRATNCPALAWDADAAEWVGVLNQVENRRPDTLVRWSPDGELLAEHPLALHDEYKFLPSGRHLVTDDGVVRETKEGSVVWSFEP